MTKHSGALMTPDQYRRLHELFTELSELGEEDQCKALAGLAERGVDREVREQLRELLDYAQEPELRETELQGIRDRMLSASDDESRTSRERAPWIQTSRTSLRFPSCTTAFRG
ncbi:MAG: hypothetical protein RL885_33045 [Planctomycetota bacterium]